MPSNFSFVANIVQSKDSAIAGKHFRDQAIPMHYY